MSLTVQFFFIGGRGFFTSYHRGVIVNKIQTFSDNGIEIVQCFTGARMFKVEKICAEFISFFVPVVYRS